MRFIMKTTGVVRKIDQLGRIVIPKEIRKNLGMKDGDGVEFLIEEDTIILRKADASNQFQKLAESLVNGIYDVTKKYLIVTDLNRVISCSDKISSQYLDKKLLNSYVSLVKKRENYVTTQISALDIVSEEEEKKHYSMSPLVVNGDLLGSVILYSPESEINELDKFILKFILYFLEKNIEE